MGDTSSGDAAFAATQRLTRQHRLARIQRVAARAAISNPRIAGLATGVTITDNGASLPTTTPQGYLFNVVTPGVWTTCGGKPVTIGGKNLFYSSVIGTTGGNAGSSDGKQVNSWRAFVMVNSRYFAARLVPTTAPYRFLVDDKYVSLAGTVLGTTTGSTSQYVLLDFGTRALRQVTIEGNATCGLSGAYVENTGKVFPIDTSDDVRLAFLGDSYVGGSSATVLHDAVVPVMADWLGAKALASGSGGTGWNQSNATVYRFDQRIANGDLGLDTVAPDLICLMASVNDRSRDSAVVQANALAGLQAARGLYPTTPIVVFGCMPIPLGPLTGTPSLTSTEQAVQSAVATLNDPLCRFVPITLDPGGAWVTGSGAVGAETGTGNADWMFVADKVHPGDEGCALLGKRYALAALAALSQMQA